MAAQSPSLLYAFRGRHLLVSRRAETPHLPLADDASHDGVRVLHETRWNDVTVHIGTFDAEEPPEGFELVTVRRLFLELPDEQVIRAGRARQMLDWRLAHRLCGACGEATEFRSEHTSLTCPACGQSYFPRISPAVIFRVDRGDRMLLARAPKRPEGWFSTLAGFVEPGESLEETVEREVFEEVGIRVDDIRYFGSQAWPFPDSLMVGFTARYVSGDLTPQEGEIEEAGWFGLDDLPLVPPQYSIARSLIDDFVERRGGDPDRVPTWDVRG